MHQTIEEAREKGKLYVLLLEDFCDSPKNQVYKFTGENNENYFVEWDDITLTFPKKITKLVVFEEMDGEKT